MSALLYQTITEAQKHRIIEITAPLKPSFVYLFGSAARGELRTESDIDIAFYRLDPVSPRLLLDVSESLAAVFHRDVDLVELYSSNDVFRAQVIGTGELLIANHPNILCERQMRWLKQYAMLNRERRPIIERIKREGSVYG
jgi:uncharacterized protein